MRSIEDAKKVNSCVNEILDLLAKSGLNEEEIVGVLKTTEECLGLHRPPMGPHPPMGPEMGRGHGPHMHGPDFPEGVHQPQFKPMDCHDSKKMM